MLAERDSEPAMPMNALYYEAIKSIPSEKLSDSMVVSQVAADLVVWDCEEPMVYSSNTREWIKADPIYLRALRRHVYEYGE